jgi:hypothetical protein
MAAQTPRRAPRTVPEMLEPQPPARLVEALPGFGEIPAVRPRLGIRSVVPWLRPPRPQEGRYRLLPTNPDATPDTTLISVEQ